MVKLSNYYSDETLASVESVNTSTCETTRNAALHKILVSQQKDKARLFIELFQYSAWRETQGELLKSIGLTRELRGVEFLISFIRHSKDLPLAAQATLGLGFSQTSLAGEFLLSLLKKKESRLRLQALKGLALMPQFHCDEELTEIISHPDTQDDIRLNAIIAAGRRGAKSSIPAILNVLQSENKDLKQAALLAAGHLLESVDHLDTYAESSTDLLFEELKDYIADRIYQRKKLNVDDLIISSTSEASFDWQSRFRLLREAPVIDVRTAISILEESIPEKFSCLIRAASHDKINAIEDTRFLVAYLSHKKNDINFSEAAILTRLCIHNLGPQFLNEIDPINACKLLNQVKIKDILAFSNQYFLPEKNPTLSIAYINAVVAQSYMSWKVNPDCILFLRAQLKVTENKSVLERLMRALGQLNCTDSDYLDMLSINLEKQDLQASTSYCLSLLPSHYSAPILLAFLEKSFYLEKAYDAIVQRLSLLGKISGLTELPEFDSEAQSRCALPLLRILSFNEVCNFDEFLESQLCYGNHAKKLLAIRAIELNGTHHHCELLFKFINGENYALQVRAVHALCLKGNAEQHLALLNWFVSKSFDSDTATLIFNKLKPKVDENYSLVKEKIATIVKQRAGPFVDDEILAAALSLYDSILIQSSTQEVATLSLTTNRHEQDKFLSQEINGYYEFSETIKVVLRNAELTWQHSELFNHVVDKSTMLVQYSKSADLLLQQRLGASVFQKADDKFLSDLQTRMMELGLDTESYSQVKMIRFLNLEPFFTAREFPAHKLKTLTDSILSGKIMADRFRSIDGLRAWSLILLLFARTFVINKIKYSPIIPMKKSGEDKINSIVKLMNRFQDLRNSAAHHGVFVEPNLLEDIRNDSFNLLNELDEVLP